MSKHIHIHFHDKRAVVKTKDSSPFVGQKVMCNGYPGVIKKVHTGQLSGMVDVKLERGLVTVEYNSASIKTVDAGQYSKTTKKQYPNEAAMKADLRNMEREGWVAIGEKKLANGSMEYTFGYFKD